MYTSAQFINQWGTGSEIFCSFPPGPDNSWAVWPWKRTLQYALYSPGFKTVSAFMRLGARTMTQASCRPQPTLQYTTQLYYISPNNFVQLCSTEVRGLLLFVLRLRWQDAGLRVNYCASSEFLSSATAETPRSHHTLHSHQLPCSVWVDGRRGRPTRGSAPPRARPPAPPRPRLPAPPHPCRPRSRSSGTDLPSPPW